MTLAQAKGLRGGDTFHSLHQKNADGTPIRMKVMSVQTWTSWPEQVDVNYKRGLHECGTIHERELGLYGLGDGSDVTH